MTKERLFEIMDQLGMVDENDVKVPNKIDLISAMIFVDNLMTYNDLETIKKLLLTIIMEIK